MERVVRSVVDECYLRLHASGGCSYVMQAICCQRWQRQPWQSPYNITAVPHLSKGMAIRLSQTIRRSVILLVRRVPRVFCRIDAKEDPFGTLEKNC